MYLKDVYSAHRIYNYHIKVLRWLKIENKNGNWLNITDIALMGTVTSTLTLMAVFTVALHVITAQVIDVD